MRNIYLSALALLVGLTLSACMTVSPTAADPTLTTSTAQIFLVRHAEKETGPDPDLSVIGHERAKALADLLRDTGLTQIYSSDYKRTRQTAAPLANALGLAVDLYDPRDLSGFAEQLLESDGRILVVGHSNTTPQLAEALGGEGGAPIVEANEYDRLYLLSWGADGNVETLLLRYPG